MRALLQLQAEPAAVMLMALVTWQFIQGLGFRVQGLGFRVQGSGFRV